MVSARRRQVRAVGSLSLATVCLLTLAACGGDSGNGGAKSYTVGLAYTRVPGADFSPAIDGLDAAMKEINDSGGVDGRDLKLISCNDNGTADGATACVQQMVSDPSVVGVTGFTLQGAVYAQSLPSAQIAYMPIIPIDNADAGKASLSLTATGAPYAVAAFQYLVEELGVTKIAPIGAAAQDLEQMRASAAAAAKVLGVEAVGGDLQPSAGQSDFLPIVARAQAAGVEGAYIGYLAPGDYLPFIQAYRASGATFDLVGSDFTPEIVEAFAQAGITYNVVSVLSNPPASDQQFQKAAKAADVPVTIFSQFGYAGGLAVKALLAEAGADADRAKLYDVASAKDINVDPGPYFPGLFTRPLADVPNYAAFADMFVYVGKYENGAFTQVTGKPIDTTRYFE
jgi:ABC-type branched-subunit amino acid transport system substrate-binding protein